MIIKSTITALILTAFGCSKDESTASKPVSCDKAGSMLAKRFGEYADKANVNGPKRVELDKAMAVAITQRCVEDKWDDVPLGCLGALANIPDGEVPVATLNKGVDTCVAAIGPDLEKKVEAAVGEVIRSVMKSQPQ
jgi:hypothetical protein